MSTLSHTERFCSSCRNPRQQRDCVSVTHSESKRTPRKILLETSNVLKYWNNSYIVGTRQMDEQMPRATLIRDGGHQFPCCQKSKIGDGKFSSFIEATYSRSSSWLLAPTLGWTSDDSTEEQHTGLRAEPVWLVVQPGSVRGGPQRREQRRQTFAVRILSTKWKCLGANSHVKCLYYFRDKYSLS